MGLDAYRAAGGCTQEELFGDDGRVLDPELLNRLFHTSLAAAAKARQVEGRGRIEVCHDAFPPWSLRKGLDKLFRIPMPLPEVDQEELEQLEEIEDEGETALTPEQQVRLDDLTARANGDFDPAELAGSISWLYVDRDGTLDIMGPYGRPAPQTSGNQDEEAGAAPTPAQSIPQNLRDDLGIIRTLAIQAALLDKPELVLDLLAVTLAREAKPWASPSPWRPASSRSSRRVRTGLGCPHGSPMIPGRQGRAEI